MNKASAVGLVKEWFPEWRAERDRLDGLDAWLRGNNEMLPAPASATKELKQLIALSKSPWLGLVVTTVAQTMFVDGYRSPAQAGEFDDAASGPWKTWLANGMQSRQIAIHRATLGYGYSYATALPGVDAFGVKQAALRGVSPRKMYSVYADPAEDEWPLFALRFDAAGKDKYTVRVYDEMSVYYLTCNADGTVIEFVDERVHDIGVAPVVRYTNMLDLDGRSDGEVGPFISLAKRIDKTDYDRIVTQHFNSWKKLWIAGMEKPSEEQAANGIKLKLAQDDILISDSAETKFGAFEASELTGFIAAHDSDVETLAAVSQTPSYALTGKMIQMSAEALAAARASLDQKSGERKIGAGVSHDQLLRLAARIDGDMVAANDMAAHVTWQDTSIRSLASAADALGKLQTMLGVPAEALWSRVPGVTKTDVDEWKALARSMRVTSLLTTLGPAAEAAVTDPSVAALAGNRGDAG